MEKKGSFINQSQRVTHLDANEPTLERSAPQTSMRDDRKASITRRQSEKNQEIVSDPVLAEARSKIIVLEQKVKYYENEEERLKGQIAKLKQEIKKLHTDKFDLNAEKNHLISQIEHLMDEKEEMHQQVLNAGKAQTEIMQKANAQVLAIQKVLEEKDAEMVNTENVIMTLRTELERIRHSGKKSASSKGADDTEEDTHNARVNAIRLEAANVQLTEQLEKLQTSNNDNLATIAQLRQENSMLKDDTTRMRTFIVRAGLVLPPKGVSDYTNDGKNPSFLCIEELRAKEQFRIERDALQQLIAEGFTLFQELYNTHRVMRRTAAEEAEIAAKSSLHDSTSRSPSATARGASPHTSRTITPGRSSSQLNENVIPYGGFYANSWYNTKGAECVQAWLQHSSHIFTESVVKALQNAGFNDMLSISRITESDLMGMHLVPGIRRKILAAVEELNRKLEIVRQETNALLRETYHDKRNVYQSEEESVKGRHWTRRKRGTSIPNDLNELFGELQTWFSDANVAIEAQEMAVEKILSLASLTA